MNKCYKQTGIQKSRKRRTSSCSRPLNSITFFTPRLHTLLCLSLSRFFIEVDILFSGISARSSLAAFDIAVSLHKTRGLHKTRASVSRARADGSERRSGTRRCASYRIGGQKGIREKIFISSRIKRDVRRWSLPCVLLQRLISGRSLDTMAVKTQ